MSIPDPTQPSAPSGWYPTGETGPDGLPVERWWDGAAWSAMVRPLGSVDSGAPGGGKTVSDPIDGLTVPLPSGWTGSSGSTSGSGAWPTLSTGPYACPSALASQNGSSSSSTPECTRGGVNFTTTSGSSAQSVATSDIATMAK